MRHPPFVLASASSARRALLKSSGIAAEIIPSNIDESDAQSSSVEELVLELARKKAAAVSTVRPRSIVLGCDSLLQFNTTGWGKPGSKEAAVSLWRQLRGNEGELLTGHWLIDGTASRAVGEVTRTTVHFSLASDEEIERYVATGEPLELAGAFSLNGRGACLIDGVDGDPNSVIGLSLASLRRLLRELGYSIFDFVETASADDLA